jgi:prophage tail gpP-like protein
MSIGKEPVTDENDDSVRIKFGADDVRIVEHYSFHSSILQQPAAFTVKLSAGRGTSAILARYPPGPSTRVALYIGPYRQFTGELDAPNASGDANGSSIEFKGRDLMARLYAQDITAERSFNNATYEELFKAALTDVGQGHKIIEISNTANRKVRSGAGVKVSREPVLVDEVRQTPSGIGLRNTVTAKLGETWLVFLERHFGKVGLFPWCDVNGNFVLSRPNGDQEPTFHFYRKRGGSRGDVANVERYSFVNDTTQRFSEVVIFARNGGRKFGHNHTKGSFRDEEMVALGFNRRKVHRDVNVSSTEEAEFYARRKIAEVNRASWKLQYTVSGHSATTIQDRRKRAIVCPDMVARVDDDELNIHDNMYIESVEHQSPPRTSVVTLMRIQDLLFGEAQAKHGAGKAIVAAKKTVEKKEERSELDILGLRTGGYGLIPKGGTTDEAVEFARKHREMKSFERGSGPLRIKDDSTSIIITPKK